MSDHMFESNVINKLFLAVACESHKRLEIGALTNSSTNKEGDVVSHEREQRDLCHFAIIRAKNEADRQRETPIWTARSQDTLTSTNGQPYYPVGCNMRVTRSERILEL